MAEVAPAPVVAPASAAYLQSRRDIAVVAAAVIIGLVVLWAFRFRGWYPHDEGTLGQAAERILRGEIPHRDFDDPYTGGLGLLHALVFRLGGIGTTALRNHLALVATVWFAGVFWLLTHWLRPAGAALAAALIVVWSVPLYPAAMPSWYVLFLACAAGGVLVLSPRHRYRAAFVAGGLIGLAALAKITAAFALSGAMFALVAIRQDEEGPRRGAIEVVIAALVFGLMVLRLLSGSLDARVLAHLALPPLAIAAAVAWREIRQGRAHGFGVDAELWRRVGALCAGAAIPVVLYGAWLARHGALAQFLASAHSVVGGRAASASLPPPTVRSIGYALPVLAVLLGGAAWMRVRPAFLVVAGIALGVLAWFSPVVHGDIWKAFRGLLPAGAVLFCIVWPRGLGAGDPVARRALMVFAPLTGIMVLTQYPFAATIYFVYVIPLLVLALAGAVALRPPVSQRSVAALGVLLILFAAVEVIPGAGETTGMTAHGDALAWLDLRRVHLLVPADEAERYGALIGALDSLPPGAIWAGPDAPEVAFLAGRMDLNRSFFGFINDLEQDRPDFASRLVARGARIVVLDTAPPFSRHVSPAAHDSVTRYFPRTSNVDHFEIHWRGVRP